MWRRAPVLLSLCLFGCPSKTTKATPPVAAAACQRFGDSCEFAPGKLGSCVVRDGCTQGSCLVCQSQH